MKLMIGILTTVALFASAMFSSVNASETFKLIAPMVEVQVGSVHASGFFVTTSQFVTAKHVVEHFGQKDKDGKPFVVSIVDSKGAKHEVKNVTPIDGTDAALVDITDTVDVPVATLACYIPKPLDVLIAAGNPLSFTNLVTPLYVAGYEPDGVDDKYKGSRIISSGVIVSGMSGGPVYDKYGNVIGIVSSEAAEPTDYGVFDSDLNAVVPLHDIKEICGGHEQDVG